MENENIEESSEGQLLFEFDEYEGDKADKREYVLGQDSVVVIYPEQIENSEDIILRTEHSLLTREELRQILYFVLEALSEGTVDTSE